MEENAEVSSYRVRELDKYGEVVYDAADSDAGAEKNTAVFSVRDDKGRTIDASFNVSYEDADDSGNFVINNKLNPAAPDADPGPFAIKLTIDDGRYGKAEITVNNSFFNRTKAYAGDTVKVRVRPRGTYSPYVYVLSTEDGSLVEELGLPDHQAPLRGHLRCRDSRSQSLLNSRMQGMAAAQARAQKETDLSTPETRRTWVSG